MLWWTLHCFDSTNPQTRKRAVEKLIRSKDRRAIPRLIEALKAQDSDRRSEALVCLDCIDSQWTETEAAKTAMRGIIGLLLATSPDKRRDAEMILNRIDPNWPKSTIAKEDLSMYFNIASEMAISDKDNERMIELAMLKERLDGLLYEVKDDSNSPQTKSILDSRQQSRLTPAEVFLIAINYRRSAK